MWNMSLKPFQEPHVFRNIVETLSQTGKKTQNKTRSTCNNRNQYLWRLNHCELDGIDLEVRELQVLLIIYHHHVVSVEQRRRKGRGVIIWLLGVRLGGDEIRGDERNGERKSPINAHPPKGMRAFLEGPCFDLVKQKKSCTKLAGSQPDLVVLIVDLKITGSIIYTHIIYNIH